MTIIRMNHVQVQDYQRINLIKAFKTMGLHYIAGKGRVLAHRTCQ